MLSLARPYLAIDIVLLGLLLSAGCKCGKSSSHERTWAGTVPSCKGLAAICGPSGNDDCCKSLLVPGGTFYRSYDGVDYVEKDYPATVSDFYLDKYEVTVRRFRMFVNAGMGTQKSPPADGAGAHPRIAGSGWSSAWNANLAADADALKTAQKCFAAYQSWTDAPGSNESKPVNCLNWYTAFAFCAWDGGRLPGAASSGTTRGRARPIPRQSMTATPPTAAARARACRTWGRSRPKATGSGGSPTWAGTRGSGRSTGIQPRSPCHAMTVPS